MAFVTAKSTCLKNAGVVWYGHVPYFKVLGADPTSVAVKKMRPRTPIIPDTP
jgi:hypothetical protein